MYPSYNEAILNRGDRLSISQTASLKIGQQNLKTCLKLRT